jgi:hypothetical protein
MFGRRPGERAPVGDEGMFMRNIAEKEGIVKAT